MYFITFEGIDGSGKSTAANFLFEYLKEKNYDVILTREPGGDIIAEKLREIILNPSHIEMNDWTEALLYIASRVQHLNTVIAPAIRNHKIVICERFADSTNVYQGIARGLGYELVKKIQSIVLGYAMPDLTFFLDIDPEKAAKRINKRIEETNQKKDRIENEGINFFKSVYEGYKTIIANDKTDRFRIINANQNEKSVKQQITDVFTDFIEKKENNGN